MTIGRQSGIILEPVEWLTFLMAIFLSLLMAFHGLIAEAVAAFLLNLGIIALVFVVPRLATGGGGGWAKPFRDWYLLPVIPVLYLDICHLVYLINPPDADQLLIRLDRLAFAGRDPTVLLEAVTFPHLTEVLQIVYGSFYFLPFSLCLALYLRGEREAFKTASTLILFGFYLSFIGYFLVPAIGPRHTLSDLQNLPLSGLWTFEALRGLLDVFPFPPRDCFPSGHTLVSVLTLSLAYRYLRHRFGLYLGWSSLLIFSTVYLRYHYVADVIAAVALATLIYLIGLRWFRRRLN